MTLLRDTPLEAALDQAPDRADVRQNVHEVAQTQELTHMEHLFGGARTFPLPAGKAVAVRVSEASWIVLTRQPDGKLIAYASNRTGGWELHDKQLFVGRDGQAGSDIRFHADPAVSGRHCDITMHQNGAITVRDLGSQNGTVVEPA